MKVRSLVPMVFVSDLQRSIAFYQLLGFQVENTFTREGSQTISWAWLQCDSAELMLAKASDPINDKEQGILFYIYCADVAAARADLVDNKIECSEITFPFYAPRGEFRVADPDGYVLMITHT
jgi:catechol 2,3-dioxygenase-like lactoylglutathione lyase family enzyme